MIKHQQGLILLSQSYRLVRMLHMSPEIKMSHQPVKFPQTGTVAAYDCYMSLNNEDQKNLKQDLYQ